MNAPIEFLRERVLWAIIALSLGAGLLGAYGRERNDGRRPNRAWWISRGCIIPFLAIVSSAATDQFKLSPQQTALLASLLALMGYEAVRLIIEWVKDKVAVKAKPEVIAVDTPSAPRPYVSMIDSDDKGRTTAHIIPAAPTDQPVDLAGSVLREAFRAGAVAPMGDAIRDAIARID